MTKTTQLVTNVSGHHSSYKIHGPNCM